MPSSSSSSNPPKSKRKIALNHHRPGRKKKKGSESSARIRKMCEICMEKKEQKNMFTIERCLHSFCCDCVTKHISAKIADGSVVSCPSLGCPNTIQFESCRRMVAKEVAEKWEKALCEALFSEAEKVFCPFEDCSAEMIAEEEEEGAVKESECPVCHRLFCATCEVPWHAEVTCEEYERVKEEERDGLMKKLASQMKWMRCPRCKFYVEKVNGCLHITCRCRFEFCYACGSPWSSTHGGCRPNY